jgi:hypothetical protein
MTGTPERLLHHLDTGDHLTVRAGLPIFGIAVAADSAPEPPGNSEKATVDHEHSRRRVAGQSQDDQ